MKWMKGDDGRRGQKGGGEGKRFQNDRRECICVFRDKRVKLGVREGGNDGRREKELGALKGTEGREKQDVDK